MHDETDADRNHTSSFFAFERSRTYTTTTTDGAERSDGKDVYV